MNMQKLVFVCGVLVMTLCGLQTQAGDVKLIPGTPIEFDVQGTPPTLAKLARQKPDETVRMTIKLPADYDASKSYPALVFLNGGDGGFGGELNMATPFLGDAGFILVNIPLFKQNVDGETDDERLLVTPLDAPYALPAFKVMLNELRRLVPNLDESRSVLAGFSNGAYSAALIVWSGDADLLSRFSSFVLIEGGFWLGSDRLDATSKLRFQTANLAGLQGKRFLIMYGDQTNPPDRIPWIADARKAVAALQKAGTSATEMPMKNTGHDFPATEAARARAWVLGE